MVIATRKTPAIPAAAASISKHPNPAGKQNNQTPQTSHTPTPSTTNHEDFIAIESITTNGKTSNSTLTQEEATDLNSIINVINNPRLLGDDEKAHASKDSTPSNSPAKKKTKTSTLQTKDAGSTPGVKKTSKKRAKSSDRTPSALKPGKYSSRPETDTPEVASPPHDHKYKKVLVEFSIDFNKDSLSQFDGDNGKKMIYVMQQLILNLKIADKYATINSTEDSPDCPPLGGENSTAVPTNMTALSNYVKGMNPRAFQSQGRAQENQDAGPPSASRRVNSALAYGVLSLSSDKDPDLLITQIAYEWARYGNHLKIKELQAIETSTPFAVYFVYALTHRQTLINEQRDILHAAQKLMHQEDYFIDHDLPMQWGYRPLPLCSLKMNVPRIPKHSEPANMARLPSNIQTCRRVLHLEVDKQEIEFITHLTNFAKKRGLFKKWWGIHAHPTEGVDWQSSPGDIRRAAKFAVKTTNYNASMTSLDVFGFLDLNDTVTLKKPDGTIIKELTGRECLTSLFKFKDKSPLIAEAHQQVPLGSVSLVYPNIPEGEKLITGLAKQVAAFATGHLTDQGIDETFLKDFLKIYVDPQLIHEAPQCEWDSDTQTLLTPNELAENSASTEMEEQGWWKDVVVQHELQKGQGKRPFASPQALFDLDGAQSIKTMHEANEGGSVDRSQDSSKRVRIMQADPPKEKTTDTSVNSVVSDDGHIPRSGDTPTSVGVREDSEDEEMEYSSKEDSSEDLEIDSTASDAAPAPAPSGKIG
jgi:hypothetical protein